MARTQFDPGEPEGSKKIVRAGREGREREAMTDTEPSEFCTCDTYTGTERNALGVKVCERCGKPDDPRDETIVR